MANRPDDWLLLRASAIFRIVLFLYSPFVSLGDRSQSWMSEVSKLGKFLAPDLAPASAVPRESGAPNYPSMERGTVPWGSALSPSMFVKRKTIGSGPQGRTSPSMGWKPAPWVFIPHPSCSRKGEMVFLGY